MEKGKETPQNGQQTGPARVLRIASEKAYMMYGYMLKHKEFKAKDIAVDLELQFSTCYKVINRMNELAAQKNLQYIIKLSKPKRLKLTTEGALFCRNRREEYEVERALRG